jgi:predicted AAA+ superfamily ATPase
LRGAIDADRKRNGRFLLLGSVSPALMESVSESLAGRLGLVRMSPLILPELKADYREAMGKLGLLSPGEPQEEKKAAQPAPSEPQQQ